MLRRFRLPWVSRELYEAAVATRDAEKENAQALRHELVAAGKAHKEELEQVAHFWQEQKAAADRRADAAFAESLKFIVEARGAITAASEVSKSAAAVLFAPGGDGEIPESQSVREADRRAAIRLRTKREQGA